MAAFIITAVLGVLIAVLGIINMTGNISSLHWYHRQRVLAEDRKPFGKLVGLGTLIIGAAMILFGCLYLIYEMTQLDLLLFIGIAELIIGALVGLIVSLYAMIRYNKGIF